MRKVFLIPGLGADGRVYNHIHVSGYEAVYVNWIDPAKNDTLITYAQKLIDQYNITNGDVVIGNSLGGMIGVEIAKLIKLDKVILTSCPKTVDEMPPFISMLKWLPLYKILPANSFRILSFFVKVFFGKMDAHGKWLFEDMLKKSPWLFSRWAMGAAVHWDNKITPAKLYQITGDRDDVFPAKRIKNATIVTGGTHVMIYDRADEINDYLEKILNT
jgi:pimeloyl-ACP methyl ester carboxylesterase